MKPNKLFSLFGIALITFTSCKKEELEDEVTNTSEPIEILNRPVRITSIVSNEDHFEFEYNPEGLLKTIKYVEDDYVSATDSFVFDGGVLEKVIYKSTGYDYFDQYLYTYEEQKTIIEKQYFNGVSYIYKRTDTLFIGEDKLPIKHFRGSPDNSWTYFEWSGGNLMKIENEYEIFEYEYDNKSYYGKGLFDHLGENGFEFETENNVIKTTKTLKSDNSKTVLNTVYEYNSTGYPKTQGSGIFQRIFMYEDY